MSRGVVAAGVLTAVTACSFISVRVPDRPPRDRELDCESNAPSADTVIGSVTLGLSGLMLYEAATTSSFGGVLKVKDGEMTKLRLRLRTGAVIEWKDDNLRRIYERRVGERLALTPPSQ